MRPHRILVTALSLVATPWTTMHAAGDPPTAGRRDQEIARMILEDERMDKVVLMGRALLASGLSAGDKYSEVWIRDLNTFIVPLLDAVPREPVREALLVFFHFQGKDGNIIDGYVPREQGHAGYKYRFADTKPGLKAHKNTVETDQESSLVQAVCRYIGKTGDRAILDEVVRGTPVRRRMEMALEYPLTHRFSERHGLVWGATTADWGDVQPEHKWGVELDGNSHRAIDIYDNAMLLVAIDGYLHTVCAGDAKQAEKWTARHSRLRTAAREHLWDDDAGKFIPHLYLDGSPFPADFDESEVHYHGGTAVAIEAGLLSRKEIAASLHKMRENVTAANAATIGLTIHPPYPDGSFKNGAMRPCCYQNGGDWTWFGARMVRQLASHGLIEESYRELGPMLDRVLKHGGFFEWWTPGNKPRGSGEFRGSAGVLLGAIDELQTRARTSGARQAPNILFILSDDHAAHAVSAYGSRINRTPHIDRLASEGMRFDNCFCVNSICAPSRAAILTGKYGHLNGVIDNATAFDGSQQTLPKLLQQAGYRTALVGKWHLKSPPTGFHHSDILPGQGDYRDPVMIENGRRRRLAGYVTDIITDRALDWLQQQSSSDSPFFLMLHHKAPHADWESGGRHGHLYADEDVPLPRTFNDDYRTRTAQISNHRLKVGPKQWELHFKRFGSLPEGLDEQEIREWVYQVYMKNYLRCVASVDENVGRILDYLDRSGLARNTIVVYTSDQGFFLGDHGLYDKRFMYEESLRMPLIIRYPDKIDHARVAHEMVLNLDFAPTLLDLAGVPVPDDMQGRSFGPIALGAAPADWRTAMYYQFFEKAFGVGPHEGLRTQRHKLIHYQGGDGGWELFDLRADPDELNNLHGSPQHQDLVQELTVRLTDLRRRYRTAPSNTPTIKHQ